MEFPDDLPSTHDKLDKNKIWSSFIILSYVKDLLSHFKQIPARNDRKVCPEPCFHFSATTFLPPDPQYPRFSNFDPFKIIKLLGEEKVDQDSDLGVINDSKLFPKIDRQLEDQSDVVQILANLVKDKNMDQLVQFGGVKGLASSLCTNLRYGIHADPEEVSSRQEIFGSNKYRRPSTESLLSLFLGSMKNPVLLTLLACGALSVGFGMKTDGPKEGWYEGASIVMVVLIANYVFAIKDFWTESQLDKLASKCDETIQVEVIRSGERKQIPVFEVVVGDIICLKIGDQVPADGLFLDGYSLQIDESAMTGESRLVELNSTRNPFLISGTNVTDGYGRMLVTSVGLRTEWGLLMSSIRRDTSEQTPLHAHLRKLATLIGMVGLVVPFLVLAVLFVWYFTGSTADDNGNKKFSKGKTTVVESIGAVVGMIVSAVTVLVVAIPEGLPFAVPFTLAYSMKRMVSHKILVKNISACETMASAMVICTDKTGTLTLNVMKVTKFWIGQELMGERNYVSCADNVLELLQQGVGLNTSGSVNKPTFGSSSEVDVSGSPTEKSILSWGAMDLKMDIEELKRGFVILRVEAFCSVKKRSGVLMKKNADGTIYVHWKGAAEMIIAMCSYYYNYCGEVKALDDTERKKFELLIQGMASGSLRCIAFAYKQVIVSAFDNEEGDQNIPNVDLILLGLIGIKDPCRPGVKDAVEYLQHAGVTIKMITGDNVFTARAVATECGILGPNQDVETRQVVEGIEFRNYTHEERMEKVDKIYVMARSSPLDKLLMVQCLRGKGHVVAVTGDDPKYAPSLYEADVGFSKGIQGTELEKQSSDIIILDDNFASVARAVRWGRCAYNNIQKFIQFHLTFTLATVVMIFLAAVLSGEVPLTVTQLLWVCLIVDSLGALALATERPTTELMQRVPLARTEPVVSNVMWRNLIFQALYQIITILTLQFKVEEIFTVNKKVRDTLIFNTFVLCQVFNLVNARKLEKKNIFIGLHKNKLFVGIIGFILVLQVTMVELLNKFSLTQRLNWEQWGVCIAFAAVSWPLGFAVKFIPVPAKPFFSFLERA